MTSTQHLQSEVDRKRLLYRVTFSAAAYLL